ncbi:DUF7573 domain-containing protein [Halobaculum sp. EA56]|uniref:DUF7573 domain-containing protein n=1 Tax=Halobaculum sp. EA56 TaxID=3421648 RepID=UPI003EBCFB9F
MPEDRSLDEFVPDGDANDGGDEPAVDGDSGTDAVDAGGDPTPDSGAGADAEPDAATEPDDDAEPDDAEAPAVAADAVEPAEPAYDVSPDGAACAACGETVTRRWRDDGAYVCPDCKDW